MSPDSAAPAIRQAQESDLTNVSRIIREAFSVYIPRIGKPPAPMLADHALAIARGDTHLAVFGSHIAGVLVLEEQDEALYIDILAVDAPWRGKRIGRLLLQFAEAEAGRLRAKALTLVTNVAMSENLLYYPRAGFTETHRAVQDGYSRVFFRKEL